MARGVQVERELAPGEEGGPSAAQPRQGPRISDPVKSAATMMLCADSEKISRCRNHLPACAFDPVGPEALGKKNVCRSY